MHSLQTAEHLISGFEFDLTERLEPQCEEHFKNFSQLTNANRNKLFEDNPQNGCAGGIAKGFHCRDRRAYGADVVLKYEERSSYVWLVYGYGNVDRWDGFKLVRPVFDRRHNVNLVVSQGHWPRRRVGSQCAVEPRFGAAIHADTGFTQPPNVVMAYPPTVVANSKSSGFSSLP